MAKPLVDEPETSEEANDAKGEDTDDDKSKPNFVDLDGDQSPTPIVHTFRGDLLNIKVGTGFAGAQSNPFGARTGYGHVFSEGDWSIGQTGVGLHWDVDLRMGLGAFEQRGGPLGFVTTPPFVGRDNNFDPNVVPQRDGFYRLPQVFVTGRNTDYLRIDRAYLSYDIDLFGVDVGRVRVPEAQQSVLDGVQIRLDFDLLRLGFFGGFRPNPWHQQVVGASSGGFIGLPFVGPVNEYFQTAWGRAEFDPAYSANGETTGPYSNEIGSSLIGRGLPWAQLGSIRFPSVGSWIALRFNPVFMDIGAGVDLFGDFRTAVCDPDSPDDPECNQNIQGVDGTRPNGDPGGLYQPTDPGLFGASPLGVDRVYVTTTGGVRIFQPLTIAWRGTLDIIGAKPLWIRDLFLDATWRNLGPITASASYFKINTWATALSYYRFYRPLENAQSNVVREQQFQMPLDGLNNSNLFVVDRDRVRLSLQAFIWGSLQTYLNLIGERRNDFMVNLAPLGAQFSGVGTALSDSLNLDQQSQQFMCNQELNRDPQTGKVTFENGQLQGSNPQVATYTDRCKIGATLGLRDAFLADIGQFDVHATHMQGYFSSNTRLAGRLGVAWLDRLYLGISAGIERNFLKRVYAPVCDAAGNCPPNYVPADPAQARTSQWSYVPQPLASYQLGFEGSARLIGGWVVEGAYYGWIEEIPYQGDYAANGVGVPQPRDPFQTTHTLYVRTLYRFK